MPLTILHRMFIGLLVCSVLSAPVSWRGGADAAHPHMFLQLWHDMATGTFPRHHHHAGHDHHHNHHVERLSPFYAKPVALAGADKGDQPTVSALGAFSWSVTVLQAEMPALLPERTVSRPVAQKVSEMLKGIVLRPETPPPEVR